PLISSHPLPNQVSCGECFSWSRFSAITTLRSVMSMRSAMDPTSIAAATASLVFAVVKTGKTLATIFSEHETAPRCVLLFQTEFIVLAAALSQMQLVFQATAA